MITPDEFRRRKDEYPFRPFRIYLRDGRHYDVPDHIWYLVGESVMKVGIPPDDNPKSRYAERSEWVEYQDIDRLESLPASAPAA